jgi:hypothetical protein
LRALTRATSVIAAELFGVEMQARALTASLRERVGRHEGSAAINTGASVCWSGHSRRLLQQTHRQSSFDARNRCTPVLCAYPA